MANVQQIGQRGASYTGRSSDSRLIIGYVLTRSDVIAGSQIHVRDLAARLIADGHDATILVGGEGPFTSHLDRLRIPWVSIPSLGQQVRPAKDIAALCQIAHTLRSLKPDIVAAHTAKAGTLARLACGLLRIPVVFTAHGWSMNPDRYRGARLRMFRFIERCAGRMSDHIINVCTHERDLALEIGIAGANRLSVIHNGVPDVAPNLVARPGTEPPRIIMVARMEKPKDHATLLHAVAQLSGLDWQLDLIGDGPLAASVRQLVRDLSLGDRVRFLGDAGWSVAHHLADGQIFALSSDGEGFPVTILEAMRAGLPVVASDLAGVREAVDHGTTGFLFPKRGVDGLRDRLCTLITNPDLRVRMGASARRRYLLEFTFEKMYQKTLALYREVLEARKSNQIRYLQLSTR